MTGWDICLQQLAVCGQRNYDRGCPPAQATALRLRDEGNTVEQIARELGMTPSGAESLLKRAERRLLVLERLREGRNPREIADEIDITYQGVVQIINQAKELGYV